jgi:2-dehydropantoate 2-reductase
LLWETGHDVVLIRRNRQIAQFVRENGLRLEGVGGDRLLRPLMAADAADAGTVDLALVLVKSYDTEGAVKTVQSVLSPDGMVLTLQNGIGNHDILERAFPGRTLVGTTTNGALVAAAGTVRHTGLGQTHLGELDGTLSDRARAVASLLGSINAGPVHLVENSIGCLWSKLVINAAINAPATLLRVRNGELPATEFGVQLIKDVVNECLGVAEAKGVRLIYDDPAAQVIAVCRGTAQNLNSMFQDIRSGRRTEIDFINAAVAREADALGLSARTNKTLALLIKSLEGTAQGRVGDSE